MKTPNPDNPIRNTLKHLALASMMGAAMYFGASPANATPVTTGLALWLDASDASTMTLSGSTVNEWRDKNGSAAKMTLATGTPTVVASGIGGIPTVNFTSGSSMGDGVNHATPVTILYVSRQTGGDNRRVLTGGNNWLLGYWNGNRGSAFFEGDVNLFGNGASDTAPHLYAATIRGSGQNSTVWAEGVQIASNQGGTQGPNGLFLGGGGAYSEFSNCEISEVLVYHRILDATELDAVGGYLTAKYGLTTTYPTGLTVALTSPQNGSDYLVGSTIPATATVVSGTGPYTVDFLLDSGSGFLSQGTDAEAPYTKDLTGLAIGSYSIKAAVTDSTPVTPATAESPTRTFTVSNAGPTNLAAVSGNELVNLSWNQVLGATDYTVLRSSPDNSSYSVIATGITDLTYQDTGLTNGTPYYYVVKANVSSTVSDPSNEVSETPLAVADSNSTVVASAPFVWADGVATSTITVTLKDGGNAPVPDMSVTLASSRPLDDTVSEASGPSDENGVVTFTVKSSVVGDSEYTATVTEIPLPLTETATVGYIDLNAPKLINVNFTGGTAETASALSGPGGGLGTIWNQFTGPNSLGTLVYSTGVATTVTITTNFGLPGTFDTPVIALPMLRGSMTNFGKGVDNTNVTINGLEAGGFYNIWMVTLRNQGFWNEGTEQYVGWWSTTNATTSPSDQLVNAVGPTVNTSTFVAGYNYVLFGNVEANGSGQIVFTGVAGELLNGSDNNHRHGLNGLQIEETTPPVIGIVTDEDSTVDASPATVFADGVLTSTVTVTLRDANGNGVPGKEVTLANTSGPQAATINPSTEITTNGAGQAVFTVSSTTPGIEEFTATDVTDTLTLTHTASVEFVEVGVLTDAAQSTVVASPTARLADGSSTSTITVTLRDANGFPVSGKNVTLANSGGPQAAMISPPGAVSDANGQAEFSVSSSTIGAEEFTATDTTDSIVVEQIATVSFIDPNAPKLINVNFTGGTAETEIALSGPGGGLGTAWNQFLGPNSPGTLVDSTGAATTVAITSNFGLTGTFDGAVINLPMLRGSMTNFGKGVDDTNVTISGLAPGGFYNIWLVTLRNQPFFSDGTEQYVGWWSTTNATTSPSDQLVNAVGATVNTSTFVDGYNYMLFEHVEADGSGNIVFTGVAGPLLDGSNNNHRHGLNGLQIEETDPPIARILTFGVPGIDGVIDEGAKTISLTVPYGTDLATLAPTFTLSSGTCNQTSGSPPSPSFATSNPVQYIVTDTSTDPDTVNTYTVTLSLSGSLVIDLGTSPAGTTIAGGSFIGSGPTNLPLPTLPTGSILRSIEINSKLEATDNDNFASDLAVLLDPTPGTPGGDFSLEVSNGEISFGGTVQLDWPASANSGEGTVLADIKTDASWAAVAPIDLATTGLFLGNAFGGPTTGGTWSGTITLAYDIDIAGGPTYATWSGGAPANGDANNDGVQNAVAWVLGAADPDENAVGLLPTLDNTSDPDFFIFNYRRSDTANGDGTTAIKVQYSSDLADWTDAVAGPDIVITPFNDDYAVGIDRVEVKIRRTLAAGGKLFARLNVVVTP